jgi:excisionase family DNA binding protein
MSPLSGLIDSERVYSLTEIAEILRVSRVTLNRAARSGSLKAIRVGKQWRVRGRDITSFVESGGEPLAPIGEAES